jgi:hypothetical protein
MTKRILILFLFIMVFTWQSFSAIPQIEREALIALYNSTNGDNWTNNSGWKTPPLHTDGFALPGTEGGWFGVTVENGLVIEIISFENQLTGPIPTEIGNLTKLNYLYINSNQLSGPIPTEIGNLTNLTELYLFDNQLSGPIPPEIGNLTKLNDLWLYNNQLSGSIPPEIGNLTNLHHLYLNNNQLNGYFPESLINLTKIYNEYFYCGQNYFKLAPDASQELIDWLNAKSTDWQNQFKWYEDIVGVFPSVGGIWKMENNGSSFIWNRLSLQEPDMIRAGDVNGNGLDDLGCLFKATGKFWIRYDNETWVDVPASAKDMICFDLGDINKDGKADIVGSWTFGTWWKNTATGEWAKLSNMFPTYLAAGDFDGDGYCDMVGLYPTLNSLWIYQYNGNQWTQISKQINLNDLRTGDFDNDGQAEILGSWDIGTWTFNPSTNAWVKHSNNPASVLCAGDVNFLDKADIIGDWSPQISGLWIKYLEDGAWSKLSNHIPTDLTCGKID